MRYLSKIILWVVLFTIFSFTESVFPKDKKIKQEQPLQIQIQISIMIKIKNLFEREVDLARTENDILRLNCLITKLNLVKGLIKASERSKIILVNALLKQDSVASAIYQKKMTTYYESTLELEKTIPECRALKEMPEGTTLVYIQPEGESELDISKTTPWDWGFNQGAEGYPAVPPASPFR